MDLRPFGGLRAIIGLSMAVVGLAFTVVLSGCKGFLCGVGMVWTVPLAAAGFVVAFSPWEFRRKRQDSTQQGDGVLRNLVRAGAALGVFGGIIVFWDVGALTGGVLLLAPTAGLAIWFWIPRVDAAATATWRFRGVVAWATLLILEGAAFLIAGGVVFWWGCVAFAGGLVAFVAIAGRRAPA